MAGFNTAAAKEDWSGMTFANNWEIKKKLKCAEYRKIYKEATGLDSITKNAHYLCHNNDCGVDSYFERTVIQKAMKNNTPIMFKCKKCNNDPTTCHYGTAIRAKNLTKEIDRSIKITVGDNNGLFTAKEIIPSGASSDHQIRVRCTCNFCGAEILGRADTFLTCGLACDCFRSQSAGEKVVDTILAKYNIPHKAEYTFDDLSGLGGGALRFDFAILNGNTPTHLIEFDGEQHFSEGTDKEHIFTQDGRLFEHDRIKNAYAIEHFVPLLRIPFDKVDKAEQMIKEFLGI